MEESRGWHSRGYLPHFDGRETMQFITFRLCDSLPRHVLASLQKQALKCNLPDSDNLEIHRLIEKYLDRGEGECFLRDSKVAGAVEDKLFELNNARLRLKSWVIMPNHVHVLLAPLPNNSLSRIMQSLKGSTARAANLILERTGDFWMRDYFDRYIRDYDHFMKAFAYIENNPVKAGLCDKPSDWRFSSAWHRAAEREL